MFNFSLAPLTPLELWQLVAVVIATLFLASVCMIGLFSLFGPVKPRKNVRLSKNVKVLRVL